MREKKKFYIANIYDTFWAVSDSVRILHLLYVRLSVLNSIFLISNWMEKIAKLKMNSSFSPDLTNVW